MRKKRVCWGLLCVAFICLLLAAAFWVPEIIARLQDKRILNQVNTQSVELNTYKLSYQSFAEKLHTIGLAISEGMVVDTIQLIEDGSEVSDEDLTEYARQEVEELLNGRLGMDIQIPLGTLEGRELYSVFSRNAGESENLLSGIQFYKLTYNLSGYYGYDHMILALYMDAEFHKLYAFCMDSLTAQVVSYDSFFSEETTDIMVENDLSSTYLLIDYWGLTEGYAVGVESIGYEKWEATKKNGGLWSEDCIIFKEDAAQISTIQEIYWDYENWYVREGIFFQ